MFPFPYYVDQSWYQEYWYRDTPKQAPAGLRGNVLAIIAAFVLLFGTNVAGVALFAGHSAPHHAQATTLVAPVASQPVAGSGKTG
jgi:hypothetical protein